MEKVILVNEKDIPIGSMEKIEAHKKGLLHRAFSIFLFNEKNELLLQQRASHKYHSGGLWTNTCCSHPREGEDVISAGNRRLKEEMGISADLDHAFSFIYKAKLDNELTEHELDHVLIGKYSDQPFINRDEVKDWKYISVDELKNDLKINPENYTEWFKIVFNQVVEHLYAVL